MDPTTRTSLDGPEYGDGSAKSALQANFLLPDFFLISGCLYFLFAVYLGIYFYTDTPFADQWNLIDEVAMNHGSYSLPLLWAQHNEHRMPITKLFLLADYFVFGGKNISNLIEIYATQCFLVVLVVYAVRKLGAWRGSHVKVAAGLALFFLFCPIQYETFIWASGVQVGPTYAAVVLSFVALASYADKKRIHWLALSLLAGIVAPLNLAGGAMVWPFLCLAARMLALPLRVVSIIVLTGTLSTGVYLIGYKSPSHSPGLLASLHHPLALAQYVALYFATTWSSISLPLGYALALVAIILIVSCNLYCLFRRAAQHRLRVCLVTLSGFLAATAFLTALGRLSFGINQATASRYQTPALLFWLCAVLLCIDWLTRSFSRVVPAFTSFIGVLIIALTLNLRLTWKACGEWANRIERGRLTLVADVKDDAAVSTGLLATPLWAFRDTGFLRLHNLSVYDSREFHEMGVVLREIYVLAPANRCLGFADQLDSIADRVWPGFRISGWAWDNERSQTLDHILLVSENDRIVGVALGRIRRPDVPAVIPRVNSSDSGWLGYVNGLTTWKLVKAYGRLDGNEVCGLGNPMSRPTSRQ